MMTDLAQENLDTKTLMARQRTDWSAFNTRFGGERTLMAAVRTSLSLIGFGFTIYKFFESVLEKMGDHAPIRVNAPRRLGGTLVSLGIFVLVASSWQHWLFLKELKKESDRKFPWSVSLTAAVLLTLTGIVLLVTILARI